MNNIFYQFSVNYGILWTETIKTKDLETAKKILWWKQLWKFTDKIIDESIGDAIVYYKSYPPKAGEFLEICKNNLKKSFCYKKPPELTYENNNEKENSRLIAIKSINEMWLKLGRKDKIKL